ncbi:TldD protein [Alkalihalobacillus alcalophilus ATCC 27647 = CGMCC 1.3604]|uniref:Peptidase C69 n=1 Tax=Alkalihalobacillus alcalophilus ATCC 27647 = CGMCC 1.3604 TaxID=1218173 RepID=A0A094WHW5_ALKAL|nr:TldD/PmbA family protein [Alkalihalobacillus alcalophilus]KGA95498.1 peptidase C69 [Alkalihalobacillus alcalophilus ATCC 27647 = CGMCC 1.3604]MED1561778.1 TldD/PmbA family protein [Alkalihalobacillus alcalophilus]THG88562.1 TldD protein [Alkalihalobacillus alcalophilus ATCC 27647 = CGMCC 1.3604]
MLSKALVEDLITAALSTGGDFAEIFVEDRFNTNIALVGGKVETSMVGKDYGIGIRILKGLQSVYAYTNEHERDKLLAVTKEAAAAITGIPNEITLNLTKQSIENHHPIIHIPREIPKGNKIEKMKEIYHAAKGFNELISQVSIGYQDEDQHVLIANSEGTFVEDRRIRTRFMAQTVATRGTEMQTGFYGPGAHKGFEFLDEINLKYYGEEAARIAVTMLNAKECPSGKFPVIIDNEFGGVIFHEACGHGLEATAVAKNNSVFANRIGERVAPEIVTYIDDGTLPNEWGSANIDDEGEKSRKNVLIENGILKGYLIDKLGARRMNMDSTGSSRRESYKFAPTSRMTNTFITPGKSTHDEIIANTEFGIYAKYMGGGSVNPATGDYNFAVNEGYIVRNGKIAEPVRGATLIGNGPKTLQKVDMVGDKLAHGQGMCGASSGSIPANVGQPMIRVSEITVGGRGNE